MPKRIPKEDLVAIEDAVRRNGTRATVQQIADALPGEMPRRTLQFRLKHLVDAGRLTREGAGRQTIYGLPPVTGRGELIAGAAHAEGAGDDYVPLSPGSAEIRDYVRQPKAARAYVGYDRGLLDSYRPNESFYLSTSEREHLAKISSTGSGQQPAGTYARQILNRLLVDISWSSSRLEGNTYSLLDTRRLIEFGEEAEGRDRFEAQMILNHKEAIDFLVGAADEIGFNRHTVLNLHAILAQNLLPDEDAAGRLRHIAVDIEGSVFQPLEGPQRIEESFDQVLASASAIGDPFEQALFILVQLPYLQPFDDVNKRVSRLSANIPFIKENLSPLSFNDVPREIYTEAILGIYELTGVGLLKDVFLWAYERSAARYAAVRQSLGEPDPFRFTYRDALREVVAEVVRKRMGQRAAAAHVAAWAKTNVASADQARFQALAESELLGLHEGNYARYRVRPSEFKAWQAIWNT